MLTADQEILKAAIEAVEKKVQLKTQELREQEGVLSELKSRCTCPARYGKCEICGKYTQAGRD